MDTIGDAAGMQRRTERDLVVGTSRENSDMIGWYLPEESKRFRELYVRVYTALG